MTSVPQENIPKENLGILSYPWSVDEIEAWKKLLEPNEPTLWEKLLRKNRGS